MSTEMALYIEELWRDPAILQSFECMREMMPQSLPVFIRDNHVRQIAEEDFVPSRYHLMQVRIRTRGIQDVAFEYEQQLYSMIDVGGQVYSIVMKKPFSISIAVSIAIVIAVAIPTPIAIPIVDIAIAIPN